MIDKFLCVFMAHSVLLLAYKPAYC